MRPQSETPPASNSVTLPGVSGTRMPHSRRDPHHCTRHLHRHFRLSFKLRSSVPRFYCLRPESTEGNSEKRISKSSSEAGALRRSQPLRRLWHTAIPSPSVSGNSTDKPQRRSPACLFITVIVHLHLLTIQASVAKPPWNILIYESGLRIC